METRKRVLRHIIFVLYELFTVITLKPKKSSKKKRVDNLLNRRMRKIMVEEKNPCQWKFSWLFFLMNQYLNYDPCLTKKLSRISSTLSGKIL